MRLCGPPELGGEPQIQAGRAGQDDLFPALPKTARNGYSYPCAWLPKEPTLSLERRGRLPMSRPGARSSGSWRDGEAAMLPKALRVFPLGKGDFSEWAAEGATYELSKSFSTRCSLGRAATRAFSSHSPAAALAGVHSGYCQWDLPVWLSCPGKRLVRLVDQSPDQCRFSGRGVPRRHSGDGHGPVHHPLLAFDPGICLALCGALFRTLCDYASACRQIPLALSSHVDLDGGVCLYPARNVAGVAQAAGECVASSPPREAAQWDSFDLLGPGGSPDPGRAPLVVLACSDDRYLALANYSSPRSRLCLLVSHDRRAPALLRSQRAPAV